MDSKTCENIIKFIKTDSRAVTPSNAHPTDVGYDLMAIDVFKKISAKTTLYETGIAISPPPGYYIEIVPRSSISKCGYMLSNSVGTIDPSYRGSLKIALTKVDDSLPDLVPPFTKCQIILKKAEYTVFKEVETLEETQRGDGGFGSTDSKKKE